MENARAVAMTDQLRAELEEKFSRPGSTATALGELCEGLRREGVPVVGAHIEGTTAVFEIASPRGEG